MKGKIILLTVVLMLLSTTCPVFAESAADQIISAKEPLKERQQFNKLRRSTRNIYKVTMRSSVAYRLQTALGYVSTIDLPEPALKVFTGDQDLFKVEVYERQVLIKPITDEKEAKTNLIIVTQSGRLAFDVSVGAPETADFVLDFRLPEEDESLVKNAFDQKVEEQVSKIEQHYQAKEEKLDQKAEELADEKLRQKVAEGVETIELNASGTHGEVQVNLLSLSRMAEKAYLRFSVLNYSKTDYKLLLGMVGAVEYERKFFKKKETGMIEFPSTIQLSETIHPDSYVYGVLVFDYRTLGKDKQPVFRLLEDSHAGRNIEIKGFRWFE